MKLETSENLIKGSWIFNGTMTVVDENAKRIQILISSHLKKITTDSTGWEVLYLDEEDGRYWELTYPNGEEHGGGAPQLQYLTEFEAKTKYII